MFLLSRYISPPFPSFSSPFFFFLSLVVFFISSFLCSYTFLTFFLLFKCLCFKWQSSVNYLELRVKPKPLTGSWRGVQLHFLRRLSLFLIGHCSSVPTSTISLPISRARAAASVAKLWRSRVSASSPADTHTHREERWCHQTVVAAAAQCVRPRYKTHNDWIYLQGDETAPWKVVIFMILAR